MYKDITLGFEFEVEGNYNDIYKLIDNSAHITGITEHFIEEYHDTRYKTAEGLWRVEEDETVNGAEFISPPADYYTAKELCKAFFKAIKDTPGTKTTSDCGLHVGMSINGTLDGVDLTNIIPNINQRLLAKLWPDRILGNHCYCNNLEHMMKKINIFKVNGDLPTDNVKSNISYMSKAWMDNAYSFIKTKYYENVKYIEFRVPGGQDYHLKFNELFDSIDHVSDILLGHTKLSKKKLTKKMYSYLNRIYNKMDCYSYFIPLLIPEILLKNKLPTTAFNAIYNNVTRKLVSIHCKNNSNKERIRNELNRDNYLYYLLEYMVTNQVFSKLIIISENIGNIIVISIPENKQQSDIIKMLKVWELLPVNLVRNLLVKLNQRSYNYFIKYYINNARNPEQRNWMLNVCKYELNHTAPSF
jgi:hypothetical protein